MNRNRGFTFVEILVTIAIIGLLSSVVLVSLNSVRTSARNAVRVVNSDQIAVAIELYKSDNGGQPPGLEGVEYINGNPDWIPGLRPKYISIVPSDPVDEGVLKYHYIRHGVNFEVMAFMEEHGDDPSCGDGGPGGCDYYEKGSEFLTIYNPGASGWNLTATTTPPSSPEDTTPPVFSNIQAINITQTCATITWTTDEPGDTLVSAGTVSPLVSGNPSAPNGTDVIDHSLQLCNLTPNTLYYYLAHSTDTADNYGESAEQSFTTLETSAPMVCASYFRRSPGEPTYPRMIQGTWHNDNAYTNSIQSCFDYMDDNILNEPKCAQPANIVELITIVLIPESKHDFDMPPIATSTEFVVSQTCP